MKEPINISEMTIKEIKAFPDVGDAFISLLEKDERAGVRQYAKSLKKKRAREERILKETNARRETENSLTEMGFERICGLDEVGRGPLAGPVMAGACIMPEETIPGINDSKKLSQKRREELAARIRETAVDYALFRVEPEEIDRINIYQATKSAMRGALTSLTTKPDILLIDAIQLGSQYEELSIVGGDSKCYVIGAASIIAKVERDNIMREYAKIYPEYGFEHNAGYGTKEHIEAIKKYGLTPIHRRSFCHKFTAI